MSRVAVVGGGLSGLFTAYHLVKEGHQVVVFEKSSRLGGHIHSIRMPWGLVETAANAMMNSPRVETLAQDIGVEMHTMDRAFRKRYIFRGRPRRLPLSGLEAFRLMFGIVRRPVPKPGESVERYATRGFGHGATKYLIEPALMGVFGTPLKNLNARLITDYFFKFRSGKVLKARSGSVAPAEGMQAIVDGLEVWLKSKGVEIKMSTLFDQKRIEYDALVVCTDAQAAADIIEPMNTDFALKLRAIRYQPLSTVTIASETPGALKGFGCLFPEDQGFGAYGVLFNPYIFKNRGPAFTETWIVPGMNTDDDQLLASIRADRVRLYKKDVPFHHSLITRWAHALPVYDSAVESLVHETPLPDRLFFVANYWGRIGLTKILDLSASVARKIGELK